MKILISTIILLVLIATSTSAQIKYFPNVFYDIDEDGIADISINYHTDGSGFYYYTVDAHEETEIEFAANGSFVNYLEINDTIGENLNWKPNHIYLFSYFLGKPKEWNQSNNYYFSY